MMKGFVQRSESGLRQVFLLPAQLRENGMTTEIKQRKSNVELFRIITMFLIVLHHYVVNSGLMDPNGDAIFSNLLSRRSIFLLLVGAWGKTGINCFVLITGYFMCESRITTRKFIKLVAEVMFYRILIHLVFLITGYEKFSVQSLLFMLIPVHQLNSNFTGSYLVFFLFIPFMNRLVHALTEREHLRLLMLCGFAYIVLGTVHRITFNYVSWFMVLFLIGSYIRMYPKKCFSDRRLTGMILFVSILLMMISVVACTWINQTSGNLYPYYFAGDSNSLLPVLTGVSAFLFFNSLNIRQSRLINSIAASTFGVLLIHAHSDVMRQWLWKDVMDNVGMYRSSWMLMHALGGCAVIFIICVVIDRLRIQLIEKPFLRMLDRYMGKQRKGS